MKQIKATGMMLNGRCVSYVAAAMFVLVATAAGAEDSADGTLNPSEYTYEGILRKVSERRLSDIECIYGYEFAKHGRHPEARLILNYCAGERRLTQAMTLLSWMDENGYALDCPDLASAAEWDRRAAELGDSNAQYNYGLRLLRGYGVRQDISAGRGYIDRAAASGDEAAQRLVADHYEVSGVVLSNEQ